jgi:Protein of unknown function (DUF4013)
MNYFASVADFFKSPKWMMNLLLTGVCGLIPFVGPIVIKGWLAVGFWGREDAPPESFPDFDFNKFAKYLERGLASFLVTLVTSFALAIVISIIAIPLTVLMSLLASNHGSAAGVFAVVIFLLIAVLYLAVIVGITIVLIPLTLRATLTQDFGSAFNLGFVKRFAALTWKESVISSLFLIAATIVLLCAGALLFCIGLYFVIGVITFSGEHLHRQLYHLYLSRGGEPILVSPKLRDLALPPTPPPLH